LLVSAKITAMYSFKKEEACIKDNLDNDSYTVVNCILSSSGMD